MGKNRSCDLPYGVIVTGGQLSGVGLCVTPLWKLPSPVEVLERERKEMKANFLPYSCSSYCISSGIVTMDSWRVCAWMGVSWYKKEMQSSGRCGRSAQIPFTGPLIVPHLLGCQLLTASPSLDICLQLRLLPPITGYKPGVATANDPPIRSMKGQLSCLKESGLYSKLQFQPC